jgi:hypothetical protein
MKFLNLERSTGGSLIVMTSNPDVVSSIRDSIFRRNTGSFSFEHPVVFQESYLLDAELTILDASAKQSITFDNCKFAIPGATKSAGVQFHNCQFSASKAGRIGLLNTGPCAAGYSSLIESVHWSLYFFLTATLTIALGGVHLYWPGLRYDFRRYAKLAAAGTGLLSGLLLCFWIGGFAGFIVFGMEIAGFGYVFYRFPTYFGERNVERLEAFLKGARSQLGQAVDSRLGTTPQDFRTMPEPNPLVDIDPKDPVPFA